MSLFNDLDDEYKGNFFNLIYKAYQQGYVDKEQGIPLIDFEYNSACIKLADQALNKAKVYMLSYDALKQKEKQYFLKKHQERLNKK